MSLSRALLLPALPRPSALSASASNSLLAAAASDLSQRRWNTSSSRGHWGNRNRMPSVSPTEMGTSTTRKGWWGARGWGRPGYPDSNPVRTPGLDLNLQERLDEMYAERNERKKNRKDIGFPPAQISHPGNDRKKMLEFRRQQREDASLEKAARERTLTVDLDDIKREHFQSGALFRDIRQAADLYGVFEDLLGPDAIFTPCLDLRVEFDYDEEHFTPVYRGNIIKPSEASTAPAVGFDLPERIFEGTSESPEESRWTLALTNPDGHFTEQDAEYLHWMVGNIQGNDLSSGETVVDYLQPFPPFGTGYHRYVFILYKQSGVLDFSALRRSQPCTDLAERTFRTSEFLSDFEGSLKPAGLSFFQSDWDPTLKDFFHSVLNMKEPRYEYHFLEPYVRTWSSFYNNQFRHGFNLFLDRHREQKDIQEELVKKKLKMHHPFKGDLTKDIKYPNAHIIDPRLPQWRRREIERERLRQGVYKDLDWGELRRDPTHA